MGKLSKITEKRDALSLLRLPYLTVPLACSGRILLKLNSINPLPSNLLHLKRIKRSEDGLFSQILLSGAADSNFSDVFTALQGLDGFLEESGASSVKVAEVPSRMAINVEELLEWKKRSYWPTVFHDLQKVERAMLKEVERNILSVIENFKMMAVDDVPEILIFTMEGKVIYSRRTAFPPSIYNDSVLSAIDEFNACTTNTACAQTDASENGQYLLTNYIIFCKKEPNLMASMALLHSRIKVVVWGEEDVLRGALGSKLFLPAMPKINHRYHVYRYSF